MESTAYIVPNKYDFTYRFAGVVEIEYNFALNINADPETDTDVINGARKLPNQIRLSVIETDVNRNPGWAAGMLQAMEKLRNARTLCTVVTSMGSWSSMLLSEITATQDEENQFGWAGDLVFMKYLPVTASSAAAVAASGGVSGGGASSARRTQNNSSTTTNTGTRAGAQILTGAAAGIIAGINTAVSGAFFSL